MAFTSKRSITIDHTQVPNTDQTDRPILFADTYADMATIANGGVVTNTSGFDIVFTSDSAGTVPLSFAIDSYDPVTGKVAFWVKIPTTSCTVDTVYYVWYGNASITTSQEDIAGVFPSSTFGHVFHFGNNTTAFDGTDSSVVAAHLTASGSPNPVGTLSGKIGSAASFTPNSQSSSGINTGTPGATTLRTTSVWFKMASSSPSGYQMLFGYGHWSFGGGVWDIFYSQADAGIAMVLGGFNQPWPWTPDTNWHRVTAVMNGANSANIQVYMDGVPLTSPNLGSLALGTVIGGQSMSAGYAANAANYWFDGLLDEARSEIGAHSADLIEMEWNNQSSPSTFQTASSAMSGGAVSIHADVNGNVDISGTIIPRIRVRGSVLGSIAINGTMDAHVHLSASVAGNVAINGNIDPHLAIHAHVDGNIEINGTAIVKLNIVPTECISGSGEDTGAPTANHGNFAY